MIKYSIIIPHYNSPDLLVRCLKSIPVREDIQVIVVDDCSPEADSYIERYKELSRPYLELYSTGTNGGGGKARNVGLQHAKGTWVLFADADDYFVVGFVDILDSYYDAEAEIVFFHVKTYNSKNKERQGYKEKIFRLYGERKDDRILRYCYTEPWGKIIRRSLVENNHIKFEEVLVANDFLFSVKTGYFAKRVIISNYTIYTYIIMDESTSHGKITRAKADARLIEKVKVQKFLDAHGVKSNYNLLSYVHRLKDFFPIISFQEIRVYRTMNYPCWPVIRDRIRLLFNKLFNKRIDLSPNSRIFI